jgi:xanthine/uracil/vitamin C permease (AzgA family)
MSPPEIDKPNIRTEAIAGVTTFFTMAYIVVVNPSILSTVFSVSAVVNAQY